MCPVPCIMKDDFEVVQTGRCETKGHERNNIKRQSRVESRYNLAETSK